MENTDHLSNPFIIQDTDCQISQLSNSSVVQLTESEIFDNFLEMLSNQTAWKNIYRIPDALNIIDRYYKCIIPYIIGKNKAKNIIGAISKNSEITPNIKEGIIIYLEQNGVKYNKYETLFENSSCIYNGQFEIYNNLSMFITEKLIDPNFQTDIGTIFHIFVKSGVNIHNDHNMKQFQTLIDYGCDIHVLNKYGQTAIEMAIDEKNYITASFLKNLCFYKKGSNIPPVVTYVTFGNTTLPSPDHPDPYQSSVGDWVLLGFAFVGICYSITVARDLLQ